MRSIRHLSVAACLAMGSPCAFARPGGGHGFSGGGGEGGFGGGGEGGGGVAWLLIRIWIQLLIDYPQVGVPLTVVIVVGGIVIGRINKIRDVSWDSTGGKPARAVDLDLFRSDDPEFSVVLFFDFCYALFARAHAARHDGALLEALSPYVSPGARTQIAGRAPRGAPVSAAVIGRLCPMGLALGSAVASRPSRQRVTLDIEANLVLGGGTGSQYVREYWQLGRAAGVRSRPPEAVGTFGCPSCGAPFTSRGSERCAQCGKVSGGGRFDWGVDSITLVSTAERPPILMSNVAERGTGLPTVFHGDYDTRFAALMKEDPAVAGPGLHERIHRIHVELNAAWSSLDLSRARPYVSDALFQYLCYFIDAYRAQGLRNVVAEAKVTRIVLCKVIRDSHFDSLTHRVFATGFDHTVEEATGKVVCGSKTRPRLYSEYWTLIRGASVRGAARADASCPKCGGPLEVNMAGNCAYCGSLVTRGDFDWVLSRIEQDESYGG